MIESYLIHLLIIIGIYIILAVSLNLAIGYTGLLNLGHIAFFGIGAYTSTLLTINGIPFWLSFLLAGILASIFGYLLMKTTNKLRGDYLALATLGFSFIIYSLFLNWTSLTQGPLGIPGIPKPSILGLTIQSNFSYLIFVIIITLLVIVFLHVLLKSPYGRLLQAIRDNELACKVLGKDSFKMKWQAMALSAFLAGIAGSLYAHYITFIDPSSFSLMGMILILTIVIIGGLATLKGSIVAVFIILLIPEILRFFALPSSIIGPLRQIIYALILILILMYKSRGLFGKVDLA